MCVFGGVGWGRGRRETMLINKTQSRFPKLPCQVTLILVIYAFNLNKSLGGGNEGREMARERERAGDERGRGSERARSSANASLGTVEIFWNAPE